jgi:cysteine desulfurase
MTGTIMTPTPSIYYLDYAATCPLDPVAQTAMQRWQTTDFANAGSLHPMGQQAKQALTVAHALLCQCLGLNATSTRVIGTSGATEAITSLFYGLFLLPSAPYSAANVANAGKPLPHVITSAIEHDAVLQPLAYLQAHGLIELTVLPIPPDGYLPLAHLQAAWQPNTTLLSLMWVNNETGHCLNVAELAAWARQQGALVHSDMAQAFGKTPTWPEATALQQLDYFTLSAHKFYGPKGIGALVLPHPSSSVPAPLLLGGGQQQGQRAGTLPVALWVGMAKAMQQAHLHHAQRYSHVLGIHQQLRQGLNDALSETITWVSSCPTTGRGSAAIAAWVAPPLTGEQCVMRLGLAGWCLSSGSACHSGRLNPSHVLLGLGYTPQQGQGLVRVSLSHLTPPEAITLLVASVKALAFG